jgi:uncharacterized damage-inducible protein DinB
MSRLRDALDQIAFARDYTRGLLDTVPGADWFRMPAEGVTNVAWQVGHLAMAEYRLCLERLRGTHPEDERLIPAAFLKAFGRDSVPDPDPAKFPAVDEIRTTFDRIHAQVLAELADFPEADLDSPVLTPHRFVRTRIGALRWCAAHEMVHAGQIALLRRLFGQKPIW